MKDILFGAALLGVAFGMWTNHTIDDNNPPRLQPVQVKPAPIYDPPDNWCKIDYQGGCSTVPAKVVPPEDADVNFCTTKLCREQEQAGFLHPGLVKS